MFEKRILQLSERTSKDAGQALYILTHKRHRREIYFSGSKESLDSIKVKFDTLYKKLIHVLLRLGLLQPFLKKIKVTKKMGEVICVANSIKCFDLKNKLVISYPREDSWKKVFLEDTNNRTRRAKEGYAPKIFEVNKKIPLTKEALLPSYSGGRDKEVFKKLYSWYNLKGIKKIKASSYVSFLKEKFPEKILSHPTIKNSMDRLKNSNKYIFTSYLHGSFTKEQVLTVGNSFAFVDWTMGKSLERNIIIGDLANFFRNEEDLLSNKKLLELSRIYPLKVRENLAEHFILNELSRIAERGINEIRIVRLRNLIN
jgi:hypothetical protein